MNTCKILIALLGAAALSACGDDLASRLQPILEQSSAELGSQENTRFTMQAIGCVQYLSAYRTEENLRLLREGARLVAKGDETGEGPVVVVDRSALESFRACVKEMQSTSERKGTTNIIVNQRSLF